MNPVWWAVIANAALWVAIITICVLAKRKGERMSPSYLVCEACLEGQHEQCLGEGCACRPCRAEADRRERALRELTEESERLGLYDD